MAQKTTPPVATDTTVQNLDLTWWRNAVVYQIYPRSFADSNGDGIGDLPGILSRIDYLKQLGIDAVWLSPFYPSALYDGGYDVDDYRNVAPELGTLADFDKMVAELHKVGIKVIIDIVPNHTSIRHEWFQAALKAGRGSAERDRYFFRDGITKTVNGKTVELPPSDWESVFGGSAWEQVPDGQWYLHSFAVEQPDLNHHHPEVTADFLKTLRFWSDRGVDGFRVDVASDMVKNLDYEILPSWKQIKDSKLWQPGQHPLYDRDETTDHYRQWRKVFNEYNPPKFAVAEAWVPPERKHLYASQTGLGQLFNFALMITNYDAADFRKVIDTNLEETAATGSSNTWVLSNHDQVRHATRYGLPFDKTTTPEAVARDWDLHEGKTVPLDAELGLRRARAATLILLALPGSTYFYQGEELGLPQVTGIPEQDRQDPTFFRNYGIEVGRDGCRVPLPWVSGAPSFGFGTTESSHLPQPKWWGDYAVDQELADPNSTLNFYRQAVALRKQLLDGEQLTWLDFQVPGNPAATNQVLAFARPLAMNPPALSQHSEVNVSGQWVCVSNFGNQPVPMPDGDIVLASSPLPNPAQLPGATTVWLTRCDA